MLTAICLYSLVRCLVMSCQVLKLSCFLKFIFNWRINCLAMLCWILLYSVNQLKVSTCPLPVEPPPWPHPSRPGCRRALGWARVSSGSPPAGCSPGQCIYVSALSVCPCLLFPPTPCPQVFLCVLPFRCVHRAIFLVVSRSVTPWAAAGQVSMALTISWSLRKLMSILLESL